MAIIASRSSRTSTVAEHRRHRQSTGGSQSNAPTWRTAVTTLIALSFLRGPPAAPW
jgi:hypothetical protein